MTEAALAAMWNVVAGAPYGSERALIINLQRAAGRESGGTKLEVSPAGNWERKP